MSEIKDRLMEFINYNQMSVRAFENSCGLTNAYVCSIKSMTTKNLLKISNAYPELNTDWLLTGEGAMLRTLIKEEDTQIAGELVDALRQTIEAKSSVISMLKDKISYSDERIKMYQEKVEALQKQLEELKEARK